VKKNTNKNFKQKLKPGTKKMPKFFFNFSHFQFLSHFFENETPTVRVLSSYALKNPFKSGFTTKTQENQLF
jgi:hypothetical protein